MHGKCITGLLVKLINNPLFWVKAAVIGYLSPLVIFFTNRVVDVDFLVFGAEVVFKNKLLHECLHNS